MTGWPAARRRVEPLPDLAESEVRAAARAGMCPWCDAGPFKVVSIHTRRSHDVGKDELRERAGLPYNAVLTSPEFHVAKSEMTKDLIRRGLLPRATPPSKPHRLSPAAREMNREKGRVVGAKWEAWRAAAPLVCSWCGASFNTARRRGVNTRKTCSDACQFASMRANLRKG